MMISKDVLPYPLGVRVQVSWNGAVPTQNVALSSFF